MTNFPFLQTFLFYILPIIVSIILIQVTWILFRSNSNKNLPPSPSKLPIIGNFHQLGSHPHHSLRDMSKKYGPLMLLHFGSVPMLMVSSAQAAEEVMKTHDLTFCSRPVTLMSRILLYNSQNIGFAPYTEYWRKMKSMAVVHLLSNTRVKSYHQVREKEVSRMIDILGGSCGCVIDLGALLSSLTNNIICTVTFGRTYDSKFVNLVDRFVDMLAEFSVGTYIPWLWWVDRLTGVEGRAKRIAKDLDEFFDSVIAEHVKKRKGVTGSQNGDSQDFVDILLDVQKEGIDGFTINDDSIKGVILDMFSAGTETTSTSLEWTISELIKKPITMKKLQQEVTKISQGKSMIQEEDLEKMHYLQAVIKESLRLHPPLPLLIPRLSRQDVEVMGYDVPHDSQVTINAWAIGRDHLRWEEPNEFKPERFLNNPIDYKGIHFDLLPFGAGRRRCPGIQFGAVVMELALANIVNKFNFTLENGAKGEDLDMSEAFGLSLKRKSRLKVIPIARS